MIWASKKNCWAATLWLSVKILKTDPELITAKDIFEKSFANTSVGMAVLSDENQKKMEFVTNLLKQRRMSLKEAGKLASIIVNKLRMANLPEKTFLTLLQEINSIEEIPKKKHSN